MSLTTLVSRFLPLALMLAVFAAVPGPSRADTLDTLLNLIEPELVTARPLIECLVKGSSVQSCAMQVAQDGVNSEVAGAMATQSSVVLVVDVIRAATANPPDWIRVLELTGVDLTFSVACKAGLAVVGPLEPVLCDYGSYLTGLAKPLVREILVAVQHRDWMRLFALFGPQGGMEIVCGLLPDGEPLSRTLCGALGEVLAKLGNYASAAWDATSGVVTELYYGVTGETPHMSYDEYYNRFVVYLVPKRTLQRIAQNRQGLGFDPPEWDRCIKYFRGHRQSDSTADKTCSDLGHRLGRDSERFVDYVEAAPGAYFDAFLKPTVRDLVAENLGNDHLNAFLTHINGLPPSRWGREHLPAGNNPFFSEYRQCFYGMHGMLYGTSGGPVYPGIVPESNTDWACYQAAKLYATVLAGENIRLAAVNKKVRGAGCTPQQSGGASLYYRCASLDAYLTCSREFDGYRYTHCGVDLIAAESALGEKLARTLGTARCEFVATYASKEGYRNPKVVCTREWKHAQCEQLLRQELRDPALQGLGIQLGCVLYPDSGYTQAKADAQRILDALNAISPAQAPPAQPAISAEPSAGSIARHFSPARPTDALQERKAPVRPTDLIRNCRATWDPLALRCLDPSVVLRLGEKLPGKSLTPCRPDPLALGANTPCYAGALPIATPTPATPIEIPARPRLPSTGTEPPAGADRLPTAPIRRPAPLEPVVPPVQPVPDPPPALLSPRR
jgi:hypothetical protein